MKKSLLMKSVVGLAMAAGFSATANAGCADGSLYCNASNSGSSYTSFSNYNSSAQYMPFTSSASAAGPISMSGLGSNEFLSPTSCPVDVNGLQPGQSVLGCYQVMKQQPTVRYHYAPPQTVRVVRPVIYVRYPVPTPVYGVPVPVYGPRMCGGPMMAPPPPMWGRGCRW